MNDVENQLVKDVAGLVAQVAQNATIVLTEGRVREIVKEELAAAKPPQKRPFGLSSQAKRKQAQTSVPS